MGKVFFHYNGINPRLKQIGIIKASLEEIFSMENKLLNRLDIIFCTDDYLLKINQEFLNHHDFTDIITFPLSISDSGISGELYISVNRVAENAKIHNTSEKKEMLRVLFHGCLHLCGYLDKSATDKKQMTEKEDYYLSQYAYLC